MKPRMATHLATIVTEERAGLAREEAISGLLPIVALSDLSVLRRIPTVVRWNHPVVLRPLDSAALGGGWVLECPSLRYASLWVRTADDSYRARYLAFLQQVHGFGGAEIPPGWDVDHLYNRARGLHYGYRYLRLMLVSDSVNRSHGAGFEKAIGISEADRNIGPIRKMDEIGYMKFMGIRAPRRGKQLDSDQKRHLLDTAAASGLPYEELLRNVLTAMERAYSGWAA